MKSQNPSLNRPQPLCGCWGLSLRSILCASLAQRRQSPPAYLPFGTQWDLWLGTAKDTKQFEPCNTTRYTVVSKKKNLEGKEELLASPLSKCHPFIPQIFTMASKQTAESEVDRGKELERCIMMHSDAIQYDAVMQIENGRPTPQHQWPVDSTADAPRTLQTASHGIAVVLSLTGSIGTDMTDEFERRSNIVFLLKEG